MILVDPIIDTMARLETHVKITLLSSESHLGTELSGEEAVISGKGLVKNGPSRVLLECSVAK